MNALPRVFALAAAATAAPCVAQLAPEWTVRLPAGTSLSAGLTAMAVDPAGNSYITGTGGSSSNTDILTTAYSPAGAPLWSRAYNGLADWHDQGRGIALAPGGVVYVTGNTPGPGSYANVLILKYDRATGALLNEIRYSSGPGTSEFGGTIAADPQGNIYVGGGTGGDGSDCMTLSFDAAGQFRWRQVWDGPAWGPYSQDHVRQIGVGPDGHPVAMIYGVWSSLHPDYVVIKYDAASGAPIWQANWGVNGGDDPADMEFDAAGDVYVTGTGIDLINKFSTIKLNGATGQLIWQQYDWLYNHNAASALALDGQGGVYITGSTDPDGNQSNFNNDFYTVKRDAATGDFIWSHSYGDNCVGCYDVAADVRADSAGNVFVLGSSNSQPYSADMLMFVLDAASGTELNRAAVDGGPLETHDGRMLRFDAAENIYAGGQLYHVNNGNVTMSVTKFASLAGGCFADCNADAALTVADFGCFQTRFVAADPYADCNADQQLTVADFGCFQSAFVVGCP